MKTEVRDITDEAEWLEWRQSDVTASAAAALLGMHPYLTAYGLWVEKRAKLGPKPSNAVLERGSELEPVAVRRIQRDHPDWKLEQPKKYYRWAEERIGCTPDLFAWTPDRPGMGCIQIKSASTGSFKKNWVQDGGIIEPPMYAVIQAAIEAELTGAAWCAVAVIVVDYGIDLHLLDVPHVPALIDRVVNETREFWRQETPPPVDWKRDGKLLEALYPSTPDPIDLSTSNELPELFDERTALGRVIKDAEDRRSEIKTQLLDAMQGAELARLADGRLLTARRINKQAYTVQPSSYIDLRSKAPK